LIIPYLEDNMLDELLDFIRLTHQFREVERKVFMPNSDRQENDSEHCYQLAMTAWLIIERNYLPLNLCRVLQQALTHDLPETIAGDTFFYASAEERRLKTEREREAIVQLKQMFPDFTGLHTSLDEYEDRQTPEAKFVYALDKLLPAINIYLDGGRTWQREGITLDQLLSNKEARIAYSPEVLAYFHSFSQLLRDDAQMFASVQAPVS
jgi:putative hydrolase of HD superfamily